MPILIATHFIHYPSVTCIRFPLHSSLAFYAQVHMCVKRTIIVYIEIGQKQLLYYPLVSVSLILSETTRDAVI